MKKQKNDGSKVNPRIGKTEVSYAEAGFTKEYLYSLIFREMLKYPDGLKMSDIKDIVNRELAKKSKILSYNGEGCLRELINRRSVAEGFIYPYEKGKKWRLTNEGKRIIELQGKQREKVINSKTGDEETEIPNVVKGALLEKYVLGLLKEIHPNYSWYHQGEQKNNERGLDLIANKIGEGRSEYNTIGVQIKNHRETSYPTKEEWLKFLAGCFVRHIEKAIFITTGKLNSEQRREADEAKITVIGGLDELNRIAKRYEYKTYDEYIKEDGQTS